MQPDISKVMQPILWWTTQSTPVMAMQPVLLRAMQLIPTLAMQPIHSRTMQSTSHLGNAATRISGNAAHTQQDAVMYYGNAAYPLMCTTVPTFFYPGIGNEIHAASDSSVPTQCDNVGSRSTGSRDRDQSQIMPHVHISFRSQPTPYGH